MGEGHLVAGIVLLAIGVLLILNAAFQWVFKDDPARESGEYNFIHSITPYPEPVIRKILGVIGAGLGLWGAYLILVDVFN